MILDTVFLNALPQIADEYHEKHNIKKPPENINDFSMFFEKLSDLLCQVTF